jgi:hypothetical protein
MDEYFFSHGLNNVITISSSSLSNESEFYFCDSSIFVNIVYFINLKV